MSMRHDYSEHSHKRVVEAVDRVVAAERIDPANVCIALADCYVGVLAVEGFDIEKALADVRGAYDRAVEIVKKRRGGQPFSASAVRKMLGNEYRGRQRAR